MVTPTPTRVERPQRWDQPFDPSLTDDDVRRIRALAPFHSMDESAFSKRVPLDGILQNDCRLLDLETGDIVVREGDYGNSAFLILEGEALVSLKQLPDSLLGRNARQTRGWLANLIHSWRTSRYPEVRQVAQPDRDSPTGVRNNAAQTRVFLHDIPRVLSPQDTVSLKPGEIFGEISALTRSPRSATIVANSPLRLLEIRWQGFRELLKRDRALGDHVEQLYRENSLRAHLREGEIFQHLDAAQLDRIAAATHFESFGEFQWNREFKSTRQQDVSDRILAEPTIAVEGQPLDGLILIRSGFARLSRQYGDGHQTISYLGKGAVFGLRELIHNWRTGEQRPWLLSLRAVGHVDILRIPVEALTLDVLANLPKSSWPAELPPMPGAGESSGNRRLAVRDPSMDTSLMEFLVESRLINGQKSMLIDLNRCTRCDDCVRACAATHDNNPRFNRTGAIHDQWMVANACMHCLDPVCMIGCPTGAISRDADTGNVTINDRACIGCSTCADSCPYHNIQMVEINNRQGLPIVDVATGSPILKATKCDFCNDRAGGPACQQACPHDALIRLDLSDTHSVTDWTENR